MANSREFVTLARVPEFEPLPRRVYQPSARVVAPALLGHFLVRETVRGRCGGIIVETEAYLHDDPACHAAPGLTRRNRTMFGAPGHAYVYFIYGCHFCVNAVCQPTGTGEAVLIRAIAPVVGVEVMRAFRPGRTERELASGPAKLCEAMDIRRGLDGADLCDPASGLYVARNREYRIFRREHGPVVTTTRIGITRAAGLPLRFYLAKNGHVSRRQV